MSRQLLWVTWQFSAGFMSLRIAEKQLENCRIRHSILSAGLWFVVCRLSTPKQYLFSTENSDPAANSHAALVLKIFQYCMWKQLKFIHKWQQNNDIEGGWKRKRERTHALDLFIVGRNPSAHYRKRVSYVEGSTVNSLSACLTLNGTRIKLSFGLGLRLRYSKRDSACKWSLLNWVICRMPFQRYS